MALTIGEVPKGKYDMPKGSWRFPMERQQDYKGVITFRPIRYVPPEIKTSELYNNFKKVKDQVSQYVENDLFNMGSGGSGQGRNDGPGTDAHSYADPNLETAVTASKSIVNQANYEKYVFLDDDDCKDKKNYKDLSSTRGASLFCLLVGQYEDR